MTYKLLNLAAKCLEDSFKNVTTQGKGASDDQGNPFRCILVGYMPKAPEAVDEIEFVLVNEWYIHAKAWANRSTGYALTWRQWPEISFVDGEAKISSRQSMV